MIQKNEIQERTRMDALYERISDLIEQARRRVMASVNIAEVYTKYSIGQYIVEDEQQGNARAEYGKQVLKELSVRLTERFGDGWSYPTMKNIRQFYLIYSKRLNSVEPIEEEKAKQCLPNSATPQEFSRLPTVLIEGNCITAILRLNSLPKLLKHRSQENKAAQLLRPA